MVRRDWCPLAKQASQFALDRILSCRTGVPREEVVAAIHDHLTQLAAAVTAGTVPMNKFVITKQLTKRPEDYPDAKNQPHVQVALRRRAAGKRDGVMAVSFYYRYIFTTINIRLIIKYAPTGLLTFLLSFFLFSFFSICRARLYLT